MRLSLAFCAIVSFAIISYFTLLSFPLHFYEVNSKEQDEIDFWLANYFEWHQTQRHRYSRRAIFVPTTSGLGDMVKGMLTLWCVSVLTNRVLLIKDRDHKMPISTVLSGEAKRNFLYVPRLDRVSESNLERHLIKRRFPVEVISAVLGNTTNVYVQAQYFVENENQLSDFNTEKMKLPTLSMKVKRKIIQKLLEPSKEMNIAVNNASRFFGLCLAEKKRCYGNTSHYIGVHARLGEGLGEHNEKRWGPLSNHFDKVALCFVKHVERHASNLTGMRKVFLATDTPNFIRYFNETLQKSRRAEYYLSSMSYASKHFKDMNKTDWNIFRDMHVENLLIGHAKHIVSFQSGFSLTAYYRGSAESYNVLSLRDCGFRQ